MGNKTGRASSWGARPRTWKRPIRWRRQKGMKGWCKTTREGTQRRKGRMEGSRGIYHSFLIRGIHWQRMEMTSSPGSCQ